MNCIEREKRSPMGHNNGIDILRIWMSFEVILNHFWNYTPSGNVVLDFFSDFRGLAVPCFMFLSFLLCAHKLDSPEFVRKDLHKRFVRLAIPIMFWGVVCYVLINAIFVITGKGHQLTIYDLGLQLMLGHVYNTPMWFMNVLLALTLTIVVMTQSVRHDYLIWANVCLTVCSLLFCISGFDYWCFEGMRPAFRYTIGRYFEMLPYVGIANVLYFCGKRVSFRHSRWIHIVILSLCCCAGWALSYVDWPDTFGYGSPYQYVMAVPLVLLMWILPFDHMCVFLRKIGAGIARYTLGIYCLHIGVGIMCNNLCLHFGLPQDSFFGCVVIFIISAGISCLMALFPLRWVKRTVS